ncbi:MAG: bifunctional glutamate N-acetyltransferase/amino-acid acetyltransferase ArgJ [Candidatus Aureabacteria bacterium]|nr:bifunctional glutamate N-acetyltransferase/amino-acid acetyltransferase ArgJ [Candidatus Auribacterota bacterium]
MNIRNVKKHITYPKGFKASGLACGIKKNKNKDLGLLIADKKSIACAVFTKNKFPAPPLKVCKEHLKNSSFRGVIVTSGIANAGTGKEGFIQSKKETAFVADAVGCKKENILVLATGKIGHLLPLDKIKASIPKAVSSLSLKGGKDFSDAILTTDTFPKTTAYSVGTSNKGFKIAGTVKGAGMIEPDMATMLGFITTDADISLTLMKQALKQAVDYTFNRISVDGCISTNDTVLIASSKQASYPAIKKKGKAYNAFCDALARVCRDLAWMIILDGEGMNKIIEVEVKNASSQKDAKNIAKKIANSNLFKTAMYGESPNWGRIFAAAGATNANIKEDLFSINLCGINVMKKGKPVDFSKSKMNKSIKKKIINVSVDLGIGKEGYSLLTNDLSPKYISINKG